MGLVVVLLETVDERMRDDELATHLGPIIKMFLHQTQLNE
jgi:hypothetical protein